VPIMVNRRRWVIEAGQAAIEIDGTLLYDGERSVPAIVLRMHGHFAHHLAHIFADWTTIADLLESGRGTDENEIAQALRSRRSRRHPPSLHVPRVGRIHRRRRRARIAAELTPIRSSAPASRREPAAPSAAHAGVRR